MPPAVFRRLPVDGLSVVRPGALAGWPERRRRVSGAGGPAPGRRGSGFPMQQERAEAASKQQASSKHAARLNKQDPPCCSSECNSGAAVPPGPSGPAVQRRGEATRRGDAEKQSAVQLQHGGATWGARPPPCRGRRAAAARNIGLQHGAAVPQHGGAAQHGAFRRASAGRSVALQRRRAKGVRPRRRAHARALPGRPGERNRLTRKLTRNRLTRKLTQNRRTHKRTRPGNQRLRLASSSSCGLGRGARR
jgi:hypothetical protein